MSPKILVVGLVGWWAVTMPGPRASAQAPAAPDISEGAKQFAQLVAPFAPRGQPVVVTAFSNGEGTDEGITQKIKQALEGRGYRVVPAGDGGPDATIIKNGSVKNLRNRVDADLSIEGLLQVPDRLDRPVIVYVKNRNESIEHGTNLKVVRSPPVDGAEPPTEDPRVEKVPGGTVGFTSGIDGALIPQPGSPYFIVILRKKKGVGDYVPCKARISSDKKRFLVRVDKGDVLAIDVYNTSKSDAAVSVLVDGLSRFATAEDTGEQDSLDFVAKGGVSRIHGYYLNRTTTADFMVGDFDEAVAPKMLRNPTTVGNISVSFYAVWDGEKPPLHEGGSRPVASRLGMRKGDIKKHPPMSMETRNVGGIRVKIPVFYSDEYPE